MTKGVGMAVDKVAQWEMSKKYVTSLRYSLSSDRFTSDRVKEYLFIRRLVEDLPIFILWTFNRVRL